MAPATDLEFAEVHVAPALAAQLPGQCAADPASISEAMHKGFETLMAFVTRHCLVMNGQPRAIYTSYDPAGLTFVLALPVAASPAGRTEESSITVDTLPAARAYRFTHRGPYSDLAVTYNRITAFMKDKSWIASEADWVRYMPMWEEYRNDPATTPPGDLVTFIYLPAS